MKHKIIVVGGGAAGMMAAHAAKTPGNEVFLLEKNKRLGKKILITGKGRCNVTSADDPEEIIQQIVRNGTFLYTALYTFTNRAVCDLFEANGLALKTERGNRIFPVSDRAADVVSTLEKILREDGVTIRLHSEVRDVVTDAGKVAGVRLTSGEILSADAVILATGGCSYPVTGSDGEGIRMAARTGHRTVRPVPCLVAMEGVSGNKAFYKNLAGLSLRNVSVRMKSGKKTVYEGFGEMLFTHDGISGPIILTASSMLCGEAEFPIEVFLDFKPALTEEALDKRLLRELEAGRNKDLRNVMKELLPQKLIEPVLEAAGLDRFLKAHAMTKAMRRQLGEALKAFPLTMTAWKGFREAIITRGGVDVRDIDPHTMESRHISGLYFAGEMTDLDAVTGGYNLQIAWSEGYLAGRSAEEKLCTV